MHVLQCFLGFLEGFNGGIEAGHGLADSLGGISYTLHSDREDGGNRLLVSIQISNNLARIYILQLGILLSYSSPNGFRIDSTCRRTGSGGRWAPWNRTTASADPLEERR